jgi:hypothetical protein
MRLAGPLRTDPSEAFAATVEAAIAGSLLRYSQRLTLLKDAQRRGIGRFEANLIIAAVVHRAGIRQETTIPPTRSRLLPVLLTVLVTQAAIVAGAWWLIQ